MCIRDRLKPVLLNDPITAAQAAALVFKPAPNYHGPVAPIQYTATDSNGEISAPATLNLSITAVNDTPVVAPDAQEVFEENLASGNLLANDSDVDSAVDGDVLSVTKFNVNIAGTPTEVTVPPGGSSAPTLIKDAGGKDVGTLVVSSDGNYSFTPVQDYTGAVPTITYTVDDGTGAALSLIHI